MSGIVRAHQLSQKTMSNIRQNLLFAFGYNVLGVPISRCFVPRLWNSFESDDSEPGDELKLCIRDRKLLETP